MESGYGPDPEPPTPTAVAELRSRWAMLETEARVAAASVDERVAEWRWATPHASVEPFEIERLWGKRPRWQRRRGKWEERIGLDAQGRIVAVGAWCPYVHTPSHVTGYTLRPDGSLHGLEHWTLADGRFIEKVTIDDGPSWGLRRYDYDGDGRVVLVEEEFWSDGEWQMAMHGHVRIQIAYDEVGELAEIVQHNLHAGTSEIAYTAHPVSAREQREHLVELVREGIARTVRDMPTPSTIRAIGLVYGTFDEGAPIICVDRTDRFAGDLAARTLDDFTPQEWRAPPEDAVDLASKIAWPSGGVLGGDGGPKVLHRVLRAVVKEADRVALAEALGCESPPLLFAMDTEREHARTNLTDAFGASAACRILRNRRSQVASRER